MSEEDVLKNPLWAVLAAPRVVAAFLASELGKAIVLSRAWSLEPSEPGLQAAQRVQTYYGHCHYIPMYGQPRTLARLVVLEPMWMQDRFISLLTIDGVDLLPAAASFEQLLEFIGIEERYPLMPQTIELRNYGIVVRTDFRLQVEGGDPPIELVFERHFDSRSTVERSQSNDNELVLDYLDGTGLDDQVVGWILSQKLLVFKEDDDGLELTEEGRDFAIAALGTLQPQMVGRSPG